jgi:hypothetical protein
LDWFPEECDWSGLDETPSSTREYNRAALGNVYGDSPFAQLPLKVVQVGLGALAASFIWISAGQPALPLVS